MTAVKTTPRRHAEFCGNRGDEKVDCETVSAPQDQSSTIGVLSNQYGLLLRPTEAAAVLRCHPSHIRALCQTGVIPATRIGDRWLIPTARFAALVDNGGEEND